MAHPGDADLHARIDELAQRLPEPLTPLARLALNYWWSWADTGRSTFAAVDPERWERVGANPVRLLVEAPSRSLERAAADADLVARIDALAAGFDAELARSTGDFACTPEAPAAFMCAEFGIHPSLPIYSGGLGVLAGDILKAASDLAHPTVGVGLLYRTGYFHQRLDATGYQQEYWTVTDPDLVPTTPVTGPDGAQVTVSVPVDDEDVTAQVWRVDVGRVPLYLLDTDVPANSPTGRWITSRLYESNRAIRLAQYAVLGVGGARALRALGIEPSVYHLNEGHPALAAIDLSAGLMERGTSLEDAIAEVRERFVFTTHTPVPAGNETYSRDEVLATLGRVDDMVGEDEALLALGRIHPSDDEEPSGLTVLALRASRAANGVSRLHGEVAREMWQEVLGGETVDDVPLTHVTNGVHVATWLRGPMRALLDRHLGDGWVGRADDPSTWAPVEDIPDGELWAARSEARALLVDRLRARSTSDRLRRGEDLAYAEAVERGFDAGRLTVGFARRLATYKRLFLVAADPGRAVDLLTGERGLQFVFAGKAHPADGDAKEIVRTLFGLKDEPGVAASAAFLEDYDMAIASELVGGCDVWVNVPRPPMEASGTSGMKACLNGGLHLSTIDGWWAEAYDGTNGWAVGDPAIDAELDEAQLDRRHGAQLFDVLEQEVVPLFHQRDADGVPTAWVALVKRSLMTNGPAFAATRMVRDYAERLYPSR
jgi:starch phosphorylase